MNFRKFIYVLCVAYTQNSFSYYKNQDNSDLKETVMKIETEKNECFPQNIRGTVFNHVFCHVIYQSTIQKIKL